MNTAKVFWSGRSQAIRLPKEFRFDTSEVRIQRSGRALIIESVAADWSWLHHLPAALDDDAAAASLEQAPGQDRPALDEAFR